MNDYFYALLDRINGYGYEEMLTVLHETIFESKVRNDINRVKDAEYYRDKIGYHSNAPVSVFEIFVSLSRDMDDLLYDDIHGDRVEDWFWLMMTNMGLVDYDNDHFDYDAVCHIVDIFVKRTYMTNGRGGPFPLKRPPKSMRRTELWYQLNYYVNENFSYEFEE